MKKYKEIICIIIAVCVLAASAFAALDFMGVISLGSVHSAEEETIQDEISNTEVSPWHIVFKGYAFSVKPIGTAIIHESGCLNVRSCDDYLIQMDVEDKRMAAFLYMAALSSPSIASTSVPSNLIEIKKR